MAGFFWGEGDFPTGPQCAKGRKPAAASSSGGLIDLNLFLDCLAMTTRYSDAHCKKIWSKYLQKDRSSSNGLEEGRIPMEHLDGLLRDVGIQPTRKVMCEFQSNYVSDDYIVYPEFRRFYRTKNMKTRGAQENVVVMELRTMPGRFCADPLVGSSVKPPRNMPPERQIYGTPSALRKETTASSLNWSRESGQRHQRRARVVDRTDAHQSRDFYARKPATWFSKDSMDTLIHSPIQSERKTREIAPANPETMEKNKERVMSHGLSDVFDKLQLMLHKRGIQGVIGLTALFHEIDTNGNASMTEPEFADLMIREMQWPYSRRDLRQAFDFLDVDGSGEVTISEFERILQKPLNPRRKRLVRKVFRALDVDDSGIIEVADLEASFNLSSHPEVVSGMATREEVLKAFLQNFIGKKQSGKVMITMQHWEDFYTATSSFIPSDEVFEATINRQWSDALGGGGAELGAGTATDQANHRERDLQNDQNQQALRRQKRGTIKYGASRTNMRRQAREAETFDKKLGTERRRVEAWCR
jgi:Ca2+-binding EF-hand superfamily protein